MALALAAASCGGEASPPATGADCNPGLRYRGEEYFRYARVPRSTPSRPVGAARKVACDSADRVTDLQVAVVRGIPAALVLVARATKRRTSTFRVATYPT